MLPDSPESVFFYTTVTKKIIGFGVYTDEGDENLEFEGSLIKGETESGELLYKKEFMTFKDDSY